MWSRGCVIPPLFIIIRLYVNTKKYSVNLSSFILLKQNKETNKNQARQIIDISTHRRTSSSRHPSCSSPLCTSRWRTSGSPQGRRAAVPNYNSPSTPRSPTFYGIYLPETHPSGAVVVVVQSIGVASRFVLDDALATGLVPGVAGAPLRDVDQVGGSAAVAGRTLAGGTICPSAGVSKCKRKESQQEKKQFGLSHQSRYDYQNYLYTFTDIAKEQQKEDNSGYSGGHFGAVKVIFVVVNSDSKAVSKLIL